MTAHARSCRPLALAAAVTLMACTGEAPLDPARVGPSRVVAMRPAADVATNTALAELRRVTARYHDVAVALADGFVPVLEECETREGDARVGIPYAHFGHVLDGVLDASRPDALLYEPVKNGQLKLVGVEMGIPYALHSADAAPPQFLGVPLQREDELGVWGLHIWIWRHNPDGMFAPANPRVSCEAA